MKKSKYIVVGSLLMALILFVVGIGLNGISQLKNNYFSNDIYDVREEVFEGINNLKIETDGCKVIFKEHTETSLLVRMENSNQNIDIKKENNTLEIENSFNFFNRNNQTLIIYIPKDFIFNQVDLDMDASNINIDKLSTNNLEIDIDATNFEANYLICNNIDVNIDAGKIKIASLDSQNSQFNCDIGDIDVSMTGNENDYTYYVSNDIGSVKVGSYNYNGISDDYSFTSGNKIIDVSCDLGNIDIKMEEK